MCDLKMRKFDRTGLLVIATHVLYYFDKWAPSGFWGFLDVIVQCCDVLMPQAYAFCHQLSEYATLHPSQVVLYCLIRSLLIIEIVFLLKGFIWKCNNISII